MAFALILVLLCVLFFEAPFVFVHHLISKVLHHAFLLLQVTTIHHTVSNHQECSQEYCVICNMQ